MAAAISQRTRTAALLSCILLIATACTNQPSDPIAVLDSSQAVTVSPTGGSVRPTEVADTNPPPALGETAIPEASAATEVGPPSGATVEDDRTSDAASALPDRPPAPSGRQAPDVAATPSELAAQVAHAEAGMSDLNATLLQQADWGHLHQVAIRKLGYTPAWDSAFFEALPSEYQARTLLHVSARRALIDLKSGYDAADFIPAWQIVEPEPADALLSYYQEAEAATGIEWEYLAAINLVETGMGRIRGLSSAGAQGPMQFLPTTWAEAGIGAGDINDPRDAIQGAARYLVRRGGPGDMKGAIWGYNNSDDYVTAVRSYAELLRQDPNAYTGIYNWEIYFFTEAGDIWLPAGFRTEDTMDLYEFLDANPWSAPDAGLR